MVSSSNFGGVFFEVLRTNKVRSNIFFMNKPDPRLVLKPDLNLNLDPNKNISDPQHRIYEIS
jgi:hypothetical protein